MRSYPTDKATISDTSYSDSLIGHSAAHCNHIRGVRIPFRSGSFFGWCARTDRRKGKSWTVGGALMWLSHPGKSGSLPLGGSLNWQILKFFRCGRSVYNGSWNAGTLDVPSPYRGGCPHLKPPPSFSVLFSALDLKISSDYFIVLRTDQLSFRCLLRILDLTIASWITNACYLIELLAPIEKLS